MFAPPVLAVLATAETAIASGPDLTRYLLVCGLLVGGILGVGLILRRVLGQTLKVRAAKRSLHVTDVLPLGGKQRLLVVRCFDRTFLIGQGEKELSRLAELDSLEIESMKRLVETQPPPEKKPASFPAALAGEGVPAPPPQRRRRRRPTLRNGQGVLG